MYRHSDICKCHISPTLQYRVHFFCHYTVYYHVYISAVEKIQIKSKSNYKWPTKILMYLDYDVYGGHCYLIILCD